VIYNADVSLLNGVSFLDTFIKPSILGLPLNTDADCDDDDKLDSAAYEY